VFWYILFATIAGNFMKGYGADTLFLAPEYFNKVSFLSTGITGFAIGIFIMSWNITTFILHGHLVSFLATTSQPFLKYCINNLLLPLLFLVFYLFKSIHFITNQELLNNIEMLLLIIGFVCGLCLSIFVAFGYFFGADKTIYYTIRNTIKSANDQYNQFVEASKKQQHRYELNVNWFFSARFKIRIPRDVRHYDEAFLKTILSRHHFSAVVAIMIAFVFLVGIGFISDDKLFQLPAAASIVIFFSILIAVAGAFTIFFRSWTLIFLILLYLFINLLYKKEIIDPRNKAYGLNYQDKLERPVYSRESIAQLASNKNIENDKAYYLKILNNWKAKQQDSLPIMYIINTSGGGLRSATFTINILQRLDSLMHGNLMNNTLFITGASGGMLGATYYRELFLQQKTDSINLQSKEYVNNISTDLLNPLFSSFVSRDLIGPVQKFTYNNFKYTKDRGYAFENKLNENTKGLLDKKMRDYILQEQLATIPFVLFNSVISRDARKMIVASHPVRFLMKTNSNNNYIQPSDADAIDFTSFFEKQNSKDLRILSALRMNATFPYVLPNVWLPSTPVIDVMDAGLRDNNGIEISLRFLSVFEDWMRSNTAKIVILQIRDRSLSDWDKTQIDDDYLSFLTKPFAQMQHNWFKLQDYYQAGQINYTSNIYNKQLSTICWQYLPTKNNLAAGLSFHLSAAEKNDLKAAVDNSVNVEAFKKLSRILPIQ
jgi:hypothetical protein